MKNLNVLSAKDMAKISGGNPVIKELVKWISSNILWEIMPKNPQIPVKTDYGNDYCSAVQGSGMRSVC